MDLLFSLTTAPNFGYLEHKSKKGVPITNFHMSDIADGNVCFVHTSDSYVSFDSFTFTVSDRKNSVLQTFYINITRTSSSLPIVKISPLQIEEGSHKIIS
ncbi:Extracellular matrix protein 3, partial [Stegodyphus mimosarum]